MAAPKQKKADLELRRLQAALKENEKLMQEAALNYENLVAAKEDLTAAIDACREQRVKKAVAVG